MALVLCSACSRHIRRTETTCPFCSELVLASPAPLPLPSGRLSRAMIFFATTTAVVGCGKEKAPELHDAAMGEPTFTAAPPYGQPPDTAIPTPPPPPADAGRPDASHPRVVPPYGQPPKNPKMDHSF